MLPCLYSLSNSLPVDLPGLICILSNQRMLPIHHITVDGCHPKAPDHCSLAEAKKLLVPLMPGWEGTWQTDGHYFQFHQRKTGLKVEACLGKAGFTQFNQCSCFGSCILEVLRITWLQIESRNWGQHRFLKTNTAVLMSIGFLWRWKNKRREMSSLARACGAAWQLLDHSWLD